MKKLLLLILFALSLTAFAQVQIPQEYTIQKPLRLETVNVGTKSDSVLVRGVDKIVKFVPRSEFAGSGGSQNLQQTLDKGKTASYDDGNSVIELLAGSSGNRSIYMTTGPADQYNEISIERDRAYFTGHDVHGDDEINSYFEIQNGKIFITADGTTNGQSGTTRVTIEEPISVSDLKFPAKPNDGSYTIATTDDIPIKVSDSLGSLLYQNMLGSTVGFQVYGGDEGLGSSIAVYAGNSENTDPKYLTINRKNIQLQSVVNDTTSVDIQAIIQEGKQFRFSFPMNKDEGDYDIATTSDLGKQNMQQVFDNYSDGLPTFKAVEANLYNTNHTIFSGLSFVTYEEGYSSINLMSTSNNFVSELNMFGPNFPILQTNYINNSHSFSTYFSAETVPDGTTLTADYNNRFKLPLKMNPLVQDYKIATTEDLGEMVTKNGTITGTQTFKLESVDHLTSTYMTRNEMGSQNSIGKVYLRNNALSFSSGGSCIQLSKSPTQRANTQFFVTMPDNNGQLALRDEFAYDSTMNTATSATNLNSDFANVPNGFRVRTQIIDPSDSTKFIMYEKTSTGWIEYSFKNVTP
jgi:hypothetical protein